MIKTLTNHSYSLFLTLLCFMVCLFPFRLDGLPIGQEASDIMTQVEANSYLKQGILLLSMELLDHHRKRQKRKILLLRRSTPKEHSSIVSFIEPKELKGTTLLSIESKKPNTPSLQYLYLPSINRTKEIHSDLQGTRFMGSDFNYSDMIQKSVKDFNFTILKETQVNGRLCWQILSNPRNKKFMKKIGYSKSVLFVDQEHFLLLRGVHWVYQSQRKKYFKVNKVVKKEGTYFPRELQMVTKKGKNTLHKTIIKGLFVDFKYSPPQHLFEKEKLSQFQNEINKDPYLSQIPL